MRIGRTLPAIMALSAALTGAALAATPAQAGGDTARIHGCAAHWRNTANWNECQNSYIWVQLQVHCTGEDRDRRGPWKFANGTIDPLDRYECVFHTDGAWNAFTF